jgi:hypothetical protein
MTCRCGTKFCYICGAHYGGCDCKRVAREQRRGAGPQQRREPRALPRATLEERVNLRRTRLQDRLNAVAQRPNPSEKDQRKREKLVNALQRLEQRVVMREQRLAAKQARAEEKRVRREQKM